MNAGPVALQLTSMPEHVEGIPHISSQSLIRAHVSHIDMLHWQAHALKFRLLQDWSAACPVVCAMSPHLPSRSLSIYMVLICNHVDEATALKDLHRVYACSTYMRYNILVNCWVQPTADWYLVAAHKVGPQQR